VKCVAAIGLASAPFAGSSRVAFMESAESTSPSNVATRLKDEDIRPLVLTAQDVHGADAAEMKEREGEWQHKGDTCGLCYRYLNSPCAGAFKYWDKCVQMSRKMSTEMNLGEEDSRILVRNQCVEYTELCFYFCENIKHRDFFKEVDDSFEKWQQEEKAAKITSEDVHGHSDEYWANKAKTEERSDFYLNSPCHGPYKYFRTCLEGIDKLADERKLGNEERVELAKRVCKQHSALLTYCQITHEPFFKKKIEEGRSS
jgi:hypothetical protein